MVADSKKPLREELSIRAYGKRAGVSHTAVRKAIASGRLRQCLVRRGGKIRLDALVADGEWARNTDPATQQEREERTGGVPKGSKPANAGRRRQAGLYGEELEAAADQAAADRGKPAAANGHAQPPSAMHEARRTYVEVQRELARVELEERQGKLVRVAEVQAEVFRLARETRAALLLIPKRLAPVLAAESSPDTCRELLVAEIRQALEALAGVPEPPSG